MVKTTIYHTYIPQSPLSQFVKFFWSSEGDSLASSQVKLLPIGSIELVINLDYDTIPLFDPSSREQCGSTSSIRLCGIQSQSFIIDNHSQISVMGVRFQPGGSVPFFQIPAKELYNQIISLEELWNFHAEQLRENLLKVPRIKARFLVLERFLFRMMQSQKSHPIIDFALCEFQKSPIPTVNEVTNKIGISNRYFGQLFSDVVGLTPKLFCRIQRLRRLLILLAEKTTVDWSEIALNCGYFDQAHFIHDFRSFAGCCPTTYLKQRGLHPCHILLPNSG
ncbi:AraC family transcriptional regulator [Plectonema cf. radiosum LEGE 06105]|uniref:AraC family transcriptional regulator n=1 Tax=Plectonema cf. radiosum LEGE 06105 TaxID=945769 RepID=A0A8J7JYD4_9CYAN|nr:helix-turn-helix domain-containing protein [Plectonema radiosum]MBE9211522.1 AraC family transcriptional regulator [Plectonema cf. radiosum LEGE 06105]